MATTLKYDKPAFLHWEGDPNHSRERVTTIKDVKPGDLLVLTASGYDVYAGEKLTPKASAKDHEYIIAIALDAAKANGTVACVVRNAVVIHDRISGLVANAFEGSRPAENLLPHFAAQGLVLRKSIELTGKAVG